MSTKAAVYGRVSTAEQADGWSLEQQYEANRGYCEENGYRVVRALEDVHSGNDYDRPGLSRLIRRAREGAFERVVVWRMDRFGRDPAWNLLLERDLRDRGVEIETAANGPLGDTPEARLYRVIQFGIDLYEAEKIAERCQAGREKAASEGSWPGGRPPFGYQLDKETHSLWPVPEEAEEIRRMYRLCLEGESTHSIAGQLGWVADTVQKRIRNAAYKGTLVYGETVTPEAWPSIVDAGTWEEANEILDARAEDLGKEVSSYRRSQAKA